MEFFLIKVLAFLRPVFSIHTGVGFAGINLFELAALIFSAMIVAAFGIHAAVHKNLNLSSTDLVIVAFTFWCVVIYLLYLGQAHLNVLGKFIIPPLTYVVAKSVVPGREGYQKMLWLLIAGSSIPLLLSAGLILAGGGVETVNYWTGVARYEGAYYGAHDMGHSAALALMAISVYLLLRRDGMASAKPLGGWSKALIGVVVAVAIFLLYMASVRTSILGLLVFISVLLTFHYKRPLIVVGAIVAAGVAFAFSEELQRRFLPETVRAERVSSFDLTNYGSNRPVIWSRQIEEFLDLPVDHQLAGIGIGNNLARKTGEAVSVLSLDAHNDYLRVMIHTGFVGLALLAVLQILILKRILSLDGGTRWAFLALFTAVAAMNFVSNSYVSRFGLAQMFYLILTYVELKGERKEVRRASARVSGQYHLKPSLPPPGRVGHGLVAVRR